MRFLVDECTGPAVAAWLRNQNHNVFSVFDQARGMGGLWAGVGPRQPHEMIK